MTFTGSPRPDLSFALPVAINLAEIGQSVTDKRIGGCAPPHVLCLFTPCRLLVLRRGNAI